MADKDPEESWGVSTLVGAHFQNLPGPGGDHFREVLTLVSDLIKAGKYPQIYLKDKHDILIPGKIQTIFTGREISRFKILLQG